MVSDFDELKQRVEATGGEVSIEPIAGFKFCMLQLPALGKPIWVAASTEGIEFINGYLDSLEAKEKARRCITNFKDEAIGALQSIRHSPGRISAKEALEHCAAIVRREFGVEEEI